MANNGWRKISSAPMDGTEVMTCVAGYRPCFMAFQTHFGISRWGYDPEIFTCSDHFEEYWRETSYTPTHWKPAPVGP